MQEAFWQKHPALFLGLAAAFAACLSLKPSYLLAIPLVLLVQSASLQRLLFTLPLFLASFCYTHIQCQTPVVANAGVAYFIPESLTYGQSGFQRGWKVKGKLREFQDLEGKILVKGAPCTLMVKAIPDTASHLLIPGTLFGGSRASYFLKPKSEATWKKVAGTQTFAASRLLLKNKVKAFIFSHIPHTQSASFLTGLATGEFEDKLVQKELGRFGLQHIMAISGFHFSLIALMLAFFLKPFIRKKFLGPVLGLLLSCYFLFLGVTPSILRAFVMVLLALAAASGKLRSTGLNTLGVALLATIAIDPTLLCQIGFQFSALTTASILLCNRPAANFLTPLFGQKRHAEIKEFGLWDRHMYLILSWFESGLALCLSVNACALPMGLYYFGAFPLLGLLYNLFFPFLVGIAMFLFLAGSLFIWTVPPLGKALMGLDSCLLQHTLNLALHIPPEKDILLTADWMQGGCVVVYLSILFRFMIAKQKQ